MNPKFPLQRYAALFLTLLAVYLLIPTFFNFRSLRNQAQQQNQSAPWYVRLFPDQQINLGLDLQGGIYLELEVDLEEAFIHRSETISSGIGNFLKEKNIAFDRLSVLSKTPHIALLLQNGADLPPLRKHLEETYKNTLRELQTAPLLQFKFQSSGSEETALSQFKDVLQWSKGVTSILEVERLQDKLWIVLDREADREAVAQSVSDKFGSAFERADPPYALYLTLSDTAREQLKTETMKQVVINIRNRIDRHGVAEPAIQPLGENRVAVELPGVQDPERAIELVKQAGKLEFKLVDYSLPQAEVEKLVEQTRVENNLAPGFTEAVGQQLNEALKGKIPADSEVAFELQYEVGTKKVSGGTPLLLKKKTELSGDALRDVQVTIQDNNPQVSFSLDPSSKKIFGDLTTQNVHKQLAILLDGVIVSAPNIDTPITGGQGRITLGVGTYESLLRKAEDLVVFLKEGALPASLKEASKTVIGPSLGKSSIKRGLDATLIAAAVVMVFMFVYYKSSGLLADAAVVVNVLLILGALSLFGATLTLPGVAGIVLTIGMAVDANVIILERVKEELAAGKTLKAAINAGYSNAMRAIIDANLTTFLSGVILYQFGTGPVRGFAVTLMIGILTTLYTAVVLTRMVYSYLLDKRQLTQLSL